MKVSTAHRLIDITDSREMFYRSFTGALTAAAQAEGTESALAECKAMVEDLRSNEELANVATVMMVRMLCRGMSEEDGQWLLALYAEETGERLLRLTREMSDQIALAIQDPHLMGKIEAICTAAYERVHV